MANLHVYASTLALPAQYRSQVDYAMCRLHTTMHLRDTDPHQQSREQENLACQPTQRKLQTNRWAEAHIRVQWFQFDPADPWKGDAFATNGGHAST